ncbi:GNAT family N-acetyltransferase [Bacteroides sp. 51]|uniref:GNAT family N-acetyltransferase n=1 Tax=Bacteroides sp. 51 TaxID=2302938 RepID=UPI0013D27C8F|nr:GNAT family N-acetyltransferase [Bacteroides sp. 51]NDV81521.1 N-acetyltransferase [Bacteroides sp. 51]
MTANYELINNKQLKQYEFHIEDYVPKIEYIINHEENVYLTHTEVPYELGGQGVGSQLVEKTLTDIEESNMHVVPLCPFVAAYIRKNPEWKRLIAII